MHLFLLRAFFSGDGSQPLSSRIKHLPRVTSSRENLICECCNRSLALINNIEAYITRLWIIKKKKKENKREYVSRVMKGHSGNWNEPRIFYRINRGLDIVIEGWIGWWLWDTLICDIHIIHFLLIPCIVWRLNMMNIVDFKNIWSH